jgi:hypothetical protein
LKTSRSTYAANPIDPTIDAVALGLTTDGDVASALRCELGLLPRRVRRSRHGDARHQDLPLEDPIWTIQGVFTITAENATAGNVAANDDASFNRVVKKYKDLETLFYNAAQASPPANYNFWGGDTDPRMIRLPDPISYTTGDPIFAQPVELNIEPGLWGKYIRYTATFQDGTTPRAKVLINGHVVDDGVINITLPAPIISRTPMAGAMGEIIQVRNYSMMELDISGQVSGPPPSGYRMTAEAQALADSLIADKVNIGIRRGAVGGATDDIIFPNFSLDNGTGVQVDVENEACQVTVKAKAGKA